MTNVTQSFEMFFGMVPVVCLKFVTAGGDLLEVVWMGSAFICAHHR